MPKAVPIPPLRFRAEILAPIILSIKAAKGAAMRLWYSTSKSFNPAMPRIRCRWMKSLS